MKRSEKAKIIGNMLDELYPETPIPLDHNSAYTLLVAVMLSAQTTDKKVNEVTPNLFRKANTPEKMAKLDVKSIQSIIREIGLAPTKAKNLSKMAHQLIEGGGVREDWDYLESLAGVGHKTIILDELNPTVDLELLPVESIHQTLLKKPADTEVVITGRCKNEPSYFELADVYSEMVCHKHYANVGVDLKRGVDY